MRLFSASGVVESAFETASTFEGGSAGASGVLLASFGVGAPAFCLDEYAGSLRCGGLCRDGRPLGPGGGGVQRVANALKPCRGSRSDHLAAGSIVKLL